MNLSYSPEKSCSNKLGYFRSRDLTLPCVTNKFYVLPTLKLRNTTELGCVADDLQKHQSQCH